MGTGTTCEKFANGNHFQAGCKNETISSPSEFLPFLLQIPSTIGEEKQINPFMRVNQTNVQQHASKPGDEIATMGAIRKEKDSFK